jgi:cholesterol 7-dehydrogenase
VASETRCKLFFLSIFLFSFFFLFAFFCFCFSRHIQEVPENAADVAHLNFLHGPILIAGTDLRKTHSKLTFLQHGWEASWAPCEEEGKKHMSVLKLLHYITIFGYRVKAFDLLVTATQIGPALVYLTWRCFAGEGVFVQSLTPEEPLLQVFCFKKGKIKEVKVKV